MKTKKKRIAQEIQSRILTIVIAIFMVVAVVVAVMVGNVSLSAQKNDLEMQSKAASYQLEIFFQEYMTIVEQMALDKDVRTLLTETKAGDKITESADYQTVFHEMEKIQQQTVITFRQSGLEILMLMWRHSQTGLQVTAALKSQSVPGIVQWRRTVRS